MGYVGPSYILMLMGKAYLISNYFDLSAYLKHWLHVTPCDNSLLTYYGGPNIYIVL